MTPLSHRTLSHRTLSHRTLSLFTRLLLLSLCLLPVLSTNAQVPTQIINPCIAQYCYFSQVSGSVAAAGTSKLTIQQPATGAHQVSFIAAVAQCPGQTFTVDQSQNGTAATATATPRVALMPTTATSVALAFSASDVGAGTATASTLSFTAGGPQVIDLSQRTMGLSGTANNYTVTMTNTGSAACTGGVSIYWSQR